VQEMSSLMKSKQFFLLLAQNVTSTTSSSISDWYKVFTIHFIFTFQTVKL